MAHPRENPGGSVLYVQGEKIKEIDLERMGTIAAQTFLHILARLTQDLAGSPGNAFPGDDCKVTISGLTATIAAGWGLQYDPSASDAEFGLSYKPIVISSAITQAVNAHHATLPRWDIISIKAATLDDEDQVRNVKNLTDGTWSSPSTPKRRRWAYELRYDAGTPATTPADPVVPSGYMAIARLRVPATSGTITVDDLRPTLTLTRDIAKDPSADYAASFVPGSSTELQVQQNSPAAMNVVVVEGEVVVLGRRYRVPRSVLTITTADPTNPRIDVVAVDQDGTLSVTAGTPSGSPSVPSISATKMALANVAVGAAVTTIVTANITDRRERKPITATHIRDGAVGTDQIGADAVTSAKIATGAVGTTELATAAVTSIKIGPAEVATANLASGAVTGVKMSVVPVIPVLTVGAETSNAITISVQLKDPEGNNVARSVRLEFQVVNSNGVVQDVGGNYNLTIGASGTLATPTNPETIGTTGHMVVDTTAGGAAQVVVTDAVPGANRGCWLRVTPFGTVGYPSLGDLPFN